MSATFAVKKSVGEAGKMNMDNEDKVPPGMTLIKPLPDQSYPLNLYKGEYPGDKRESYLVNTADLNAALDIVDKYGRVIICGPPGSGKTRLADAVYKVLFGRGYKITNCTRFIDTCHSHLLYHSSQSPSHEKYVCVEDGSLGPLHCNRENYAAFVSFLCDTQELWDKPSPGPHKFSALLVLTVYPHVLRDVRSLDEASPFALADPEVVLHLTQNPARPGVPLSRDLQKWACFIQEMIGDGPERGPAMVALALTMDGKAHFLRDPTNLEKEMERVAFRGISAYAVAEMADYLHGFILAESGEGFVDRFMYDAVGLAVGRASSPIIVLNVCDIPFLAKYVRMDPDAKESKENMYLSVGRRIEESRNQFLQKVHQGLVEERMLMELCQHQSLAHMEVVHGLDDYCSARKNHLERVMSVLDPRHGLPLLYWSVWNRSTYLNQWCLTFLKESIKKTKHLTEPLFTSLVASILFAEAGDKSLRLANRIVKDLKFKPERQDIRLSLPVPTFLQDEARTRVEQVRRRLKHNLCFLENVELPLPTSLIRVTLDSDSLEVKMQSRNWYLVLRLLTDEDLEEKDDKGNTVLLMAAQAHLSDVVHMVVKSRASSTGRRSRMGMRMGMGLRMDMDMDMEMEMMMPCRLGMDMEMMMPHRMARRRMHMMERYSTGCEPTGPHRDSVIHEAVREGFKDVVHVLLSNGYKGDDRDKRGDTPLHVACRAGHKDLAEIFIKLKVDVNARNHNNMTPLHEASAQGHNDLVTLLVKHGADINASSSQR